MQRWPAHRIASVLVIAALAALLQGCVNEFSQDLFTPRPATTVESTEDDTRLRVARRTAESGDLVVAARLYQALAEENPRSIEIRVEFAEVLEDLERHRVAAVIWQDLVGLQPETAEWRIRQVRALLADESPLAALERAEDGLAVLGEEPKLLGLAGVAASLVGRPEVAEHHFRRAVAASPSDPDQLANYAYFLIQQGRLAEAAPLLEEAVRLPGAGPRHRQNLALAYGLLGREAEAARLLRRDLAEEEAGRRLAEWRRLRAPAPAAGSD